MSGTRKRSPSRAPVLAWVCVFALAGAAAAEEIWVASGPAGGTYREFYARSLERYLQGYQIRHRKTVGSGENLDLLASGKADLVFAQADVFAERLRREPDRFGNLIVIGKLADECVYVAHRRRGPVVVFEQLGQLVNGREPKIAVGPERGGAAGTWSQLVVLQPTLGGAAVHHQGGTLALNQLVVGVFDAVVWVTDPRNFNHKMMLAVSGNEELGLMELTDPALTHSLPDGTWVYEQRRVKLQPGLQAPHLESVCTSALAFARTDTDERLVTRLADIVSLKLSRLSPGPE